MDVAISVGSRLSGIREKGIEAIVEHVQLAEKKGFSAAFAPDHYVYEALGELLLDTPAYDVMFLLATLAQRTQKIRLGSHVACMLFRHPAMHARLFAQIDEASGGRVIAGVGAGWIEAEFEMMGIEFPNVTDRLQMMEEAVVIMRGLWGEEPFSFAGDYYEVTAAVSLPKPVQKPGPPIMIGGSGNGILRRAGAWADLLHMVPATGRAGTMKLEEIRKFDDAAMQRKMERVRQAEKDAGRPARSVQLATTVFTYAMTESRAETEKTLGGLAELFGASPDQVRKHPVALVGTPEEMIDELERREALHDLSMLVLTFGNDTDLQKFADEVLAKR